MSVPGFTGDPGNGSASDTAVMALAFAPHAKVTIRFDSDYFYVESDGIAGHQMMVNITEWIAQVPVPHPYTGDNAWSIPLNPVYTDDNVTIAADLQRGAIAIAANGIPIFNPVNASGLISKEIGELDDFGGHSGRADDYHYHAAPLHLQTADNRPIAYAFDGFPVYGSTEPDGTAMQELDALHGHEAADGTYHYHGTESFPYILTALRGEVTLDPMTSAPQTQIIPQARTEAFRDPPHGIPTDDLIITSLTANGTGNGYELEYEISGTPGSVVYSWTEDDLTTFVFNDVDGSTTTEVFDRGAVGGGQDPPEGGPGPPPDDQTGSPTDAVADTPGFVLTSAAISDGVLLGDFKCERKADDGTKASIPLAWSGVPEGTGSLAISMHHFPNANDTDPSKANQYLLLWGIDPSVTEIAHGAADDGAWFMGSDKDGTRPSYTSPCSQSTGTHEYTITIYALSETPSSLPQASSVEVTYTVLLAALESVVELGRTTLTFNDVTN
jgi:phosphatidylethanolamine-binding protein (PEBP) family uncharacterized protein